MGGKQVSPWGGWSRVPLGPPGDRVLSPPRGAVLSMHHLSPSLPGEGRGRGVPRAAAPLPCAKGEPVSSRREAWAGGLGRESAFASGSQEMPPLPPLWGPPFWQQRPKKQENILGTPMSL